MSSARYRNLHVPLPESLDERLRVIAKRQGTPTTSAARKAIEYWLQEQERAAVHEAVAEYARSTAGTAADLDQDLEAAAIGHLLGEDEGET